MFARQFTYLLGTLLTIFGIAGFFVDGSLLAFDVDTVQNVLHVTSGILGLIAASRGPKLAKWFLILFGIVYGVVALLGYVNADALGFLRINQATTYLHTGIAAACLFFGFTSKA